MNNFTKRLLSSIVFVSLLLGCINYSGYSFVFLFGLITFFGLNEFYSLVQKDSAQPERFVASAIGAAFFFACSFAAMGKYPWTYLLVFIPIPFLFFIKELFSGSKYPFRNIGYNVLGLLYVALPFTLLSIVAFMGGAYNTHLVLSFFLVLWASDTGAYLVGVRFGKTRLFEKISPKKSWEGSIGGTASAFLAAYVVHSWFGSYTLTHWFVLAFIIVVAGTLGDLSESQLKRSIDVKDSGNIMPGHGGFLDRFDALLIALPFLFVYVYFFI